jgi:ribonuclease VapC
VIATMTPELCVDSSAIVCFLNREGGWEQIAHALDGAKSRLFSAASLVEVGIVMAGSYGDDVGYLTRGAVAELGLTVVPVDQRHAIRAIEAFSMFGKGRHPAKLNYGDCFTYATAAIAGLPILCVGDDFAKTDIEVIPITP